MIPAVAEDPLAPPRRRRRFLVVVHRDRSDTQRFVFFTFAGVKGTERNRTPVACEDGIRDRRRHDRRCRLAGTPRRLARPVDDENLDSRHVGKSQDWKRSPNETCHRRTRLETPRGKSASPPARLAREGALTHLVLTQKAVLYLQKHDGATVRPGRLSEGGRFRLKLRDPVFGWSSDRAQNRPSLYRSAPPEVSRRPDVTACQATAIKAAAPKGSPSIMAVKVCLRSAATPADQQRWEGCL